MKKLNNKGFSLVELIIVIAIMVVLVGVLAPQFIKYVESSRSSTDMQNMELVKTAIEVAATDETYSVGTITVNNTAISWSCTDGTNDIALPGLPSGKTINLKSGKWGDSTSTVTYSYSTTTGWSVTSGAAITNSANTSRKTSSIFN